MVSDEAKKEERQKGEKLRRKTKENPGGEKMTAHKPRAKTGRGQEGINDTSALESTRGTRGKTRTEGNTKILKSEAPKKDRRSRRQ